MSGYLAARAGGGKLTQRTYAKIHRVNLRTFQGYLQHHGVAVAKSMGLCVSRVPKSEPVPARVQLTNRDLQMLARLGHDRMHDLPFLAGLWFSSSKTPPKSAMTRLRLLERAGYIAVIQTRLPLVTLTAKGARRIGSQARPIHTRHLKHHLATLRAIEAYRQEVEAVGGRFVARPMAHGHEAEYLLEFHIQAGERHGAGTAAGIRYETSPDAVVFAELPDPNTGELRFQRIAIEYFTASYSDAQIRSKMEFATTFDAVYQVADVAATAQRVAAITKSPCSARRSV